MNGTFSLPGRRLVPELMDTEVVSYQHFRACLVDLERVNRASLGYRPTLRWLDRIAEGRNSLRILDVGSGHGDMLRQIWRWSQRRGIEVELTGVDLNPWCARAAAEATPPEMSIRYETGNLFDIGPDRQFDVIVSALFAHHLDDEELLRFVSWMDRTASLGWFVNDLHRHPIPEWGLRAIFAALPVHRFVRHDGPVSVRRAFDRHDLEALTRAAGLDPVRTAVRWQFPFRWGYGTVPR